MDKLERGRVYVLRDVGGQAVPLALDNQGAYTEWAGCFSGLGLR